ncbi:MAG TPA: tyrosine-type recombinase/integrase [Terriglobia bacterium]|nr:tyrosine-type recombinase/integrase [Terriglobia bacterium]
MPANRTNRIPSYRHHKPSGQAVVTLNGKDFYLGKYDTTESRAEYERIVAEWLANGRLLPGGAAGGPADITVAEVVAAHHNFALTYYGPDSPEHCRLRSALRPVLRLYGHTRAAEFGPMALKVVRNQFVEAGHCRNYVNQMVETIKRVLRWAAESELVPPSVYHGVQAVAGLRRGRCDARESEPVRPVPDDLVEAVKPHVSRQVAAMIELQQLTGMRPGEAVIMRGCDLDVTGDLWLYRPEHHKNEHRGHERIIELGPKAQRVIREFLKTDTGAYLFSPAEAERERNEQRGAERKTKRWPSHMRRNKAKRKRQPKRVPASHYTSISYYRAIERGSDKAFPHPTLFGVPLNQLTDEQRAELAQWRKEHRWHPHQLRHNFATRIRKEFGLDVARAMLGHRSVQVTEVYAEVDRAKAAETAAAIG